jgi:diaminopimelate epimerase
MNKDQNIINFKEVKFISMNGAGNKLLIHDSRNQKLSITKELLKFLLDKDELISFDQFIQILSPDKNGDVKVLFWNADGSEAEMCGNGIRCIAKIIIEEKNKKEIIIETINREVNCWEDNKNIAVDMGRPKFLWTEIPLKDGTDSLSTLSVELPSPPCALPKFTAVNIGNPHAVFFFNSINMPDLNNFGGSIEKNKIFPNKVNVSFASIIDKENISLNVWERGAGITQACGSAACATAVASSKLNLAKRKVNILLPGGKLEINWKKDDQIVMTGPYEFNSEDILDISNYK